MRKQLQNTAQTTLLRQLMRKDLVSILDVGEYETFHRLLTTLTILLVSKSNDGAFQ